MRDVRATFVIGPDKRIKLMYTYPMSTGRNFGELLRVIDSLQLTARHKLATPPNWRPGDDAIIVPAVSDEDARKVFPDGWKAPKPYMRIVPQRRVKPATVPDVWIEAPFLRGSGGSTAPQFDSRDVRRTVRTKSRREHAPVSGRRPRCGPRPDS